MSTIKKGSWCPFCNNGKLCKNDICFKCITKSFLSCSKSMHWSDKNLIPAHYVTLHAKEKYIFHCYICNHDFSSILASITKGH